MLATSDKNILPMVGQLAGIRWETDRRPQPATFIFGKVLFTDGAFQLFKAWRKYQFKVFIEGD